MIAVNNIKLRTHTRDSNAQQNTSNSFRINLLSVNDRFASCLGGSSTLIVSQAKTMSGSPQKSIRRSSCSSFASSTLRTHSDEPADDASEELVEVEPASASHAPATITIFFNAHTSTRKTTAPRDVTLEQLRTLFFEHMQPPNVDSVSDLPPLYIRDRETQIEYELVHIVSVLRILK